MDYIYSFVALIVFGYLFVTVACVSWALRSFVDLIEFLVGRTVTLSVAAVVILSVAVDLTPIGTVFIGTFVGFQIHRMWVIGDIRVCTYEEIIELIGRAMFLVGIAGVLSLA